MMRAYAGPPVFACRGGRPRCRAITRRLTSATAIDYGLISAGISLAIIAVVNGLGTDLNTKFTSINNSLR
jgi:pilus assembly protein Flp/PilA